MLTNIILNAESCLQVYDYILTFSDEKRLVWPSRRSIIKVVFLLNRYLPIFNIAFYVQGAHGKAISITTIGLTNKLVVLVEAVKNGQNAKVRFSNLVLKHDVF